MEACHREGTCEYDLSILGTQPGRQTLLPIVCPSGGDHQEHRLPVKERWPTSEAFQVDGVDVAAVLAWAEATASPDAPTRCTRWLTVTVLPGLSGWRVATRRHRPVMRGSCPPSPLGDQPRDGRWQDRPCLARGWPIGPWSRRTRAPEASATRRDRTELNQGEDFRPVTDQLPRSAHRQVADLSTVVSVLRACYESGCGD